MPGLNQRYFKDGFDWSEDCMTRKAKSQGCTEVLNKQVHAGTHIKIGSPGNEVCLGGKTVSMGLKLWIIHVKRSDGLLDTQSWSSGQGGTREPCMHWW